MTFHTKYLQKRQYLQYIGENIINLSSADYNQRWYRLTFRTCWANSVDNNITTKRYSSYFSQQIGFDISWKLSQKISKIIQNAVYCNFYPACKLFISQYLIFQIQSTPVILKSKGLSEKTLRYLYLDISDLEN